MKKVLLAMTLAAAAAFCSGAQSLDVELQRAAQKEMVTGNLAVAIEEYKDIVARAGSNKKVAAQALIRMAECHTKLGDAEARKIYERVLREYGDQKEAVAVARARLGRGRPEQNAKGDRVVWAGREMYSDGRISLDGRFISYTDWFETGNLVVYDLATGAHRPLTGNQDWGTGNAYSSAFSRDGKQLAYGWRGYKPWLNELRIVNIDGTGVPEPRTVVANSDEIGSWDVRDWSPDGRWLAVLVGRKDRSSQMGVVRIQDGSLRVLRSLEWRSPGKMFFSPDGKYLAYDLPASEEEPTRHDVFVMAVGASRETPVVAHQAHDIVMGWSPDGNQLLFASDRTGSMGLWSLPVASGKPNGTPVLLKPDVGAVTSLGLTASGTLHVMKDASTTKLMLAPIDLASGKLSGPPVVENYVQSTRPDWTRDGKYMAYPSMGTSGIRTLTIRSIETGQIRELRPRLKYYNEPRWMPDGKSLITFARDFKWREGIYRIDAQTGDATFITNCRSTRVQVSPDGKKIYHGVDQSPRDPQPPGIAERDLASGETKVLFRMPEGFGWGGAELSPDGRYLAVAFAKPPAVVLVPTHGGGPKEIIRVKPPEYFNAFGHMTWTPDSNAVIAVKVIGDRRELWLLPVDGSNARKLDVDMKDWMNGPGIRLHPNGKQISFTSGQSTREIWALENFLPAMKASR